MQLKIAGKIYCVDFSHDLPRLADTRCANWLGQDVMLTGGTSCWIYEAGSERQAEVRRGEAPADGFAYCHPKDQFCKRQGRKISFSRALACFSRSERAEWWAAYFAAMPGDKRSF